MSRTWIADTPKKVDETVVLKGWVQSRRDHGNLIFIDLRDRSGIIQVVFWKGGDKEVFAQAETLRDEFVISIKGKVQKRGAKQINPDLPTGAVEIGVDEITILSKAETPAFEVLKAAEIGEETRMKHRHLDLRSERMKNNLEKRHRVTKLLRDELDSQGFWEVETPALTKGTPEGAREFIVPSRLHPGSFYALPQSPQQFKQLLMAGGVERYFQIARCFRDEDTRGDRQAEFTQLDMELSFTDEEEVMALNEKLLIKIVEELYPEKRIQQVPFPRISYKDAIEKHGSDRPDLREDKDDENLLAFCWIVDFPMFEKTDGKKWTFTHNPFSAAKSDHKKWLTDQENIGEIIATQYDIVLNGFEIGGGSIRSYDVKELQSIFEIIGYTKKEIAENFGHILDAFKSGVPPHGGIAWGLDRLVMILQNEPSIRDVIAFPKTGDGRDTLMGAPSELPDKMISESGLTS